jgi:NTP pyrophosphatase (non-canonical NTP hydrolase)
MADALRALQQRLAAFAAARDWDQFHSPKNLAMALSVEAAELVEEFQWLTEEQSRRLDTERRERVRLELADVFIYLLRVADKLGVDLLQAADDKIALNERKYPAERVRGDSRKYDEY